jgi:hypothetical protein
MDAILSAKKPKSSVLFSSHRRKVFYDFGGLVSRTFDDYANDIILPHIKSLAQSHLRVDVVFDVYYYDSLRTLFFGFIFVTPKKSVL